MNEYTVIKNYHYCELYHVEALSEKAAIEMVDDVEFDQEPDDIIQDFDFYDVFKLKDDNE